ncbi:sulfur carrier protein ThiS adenylyltransferase ThiF [Desulfatitalea alkaliphila]|uniref:Sulfur carrier protein ThiS adenylyltransferase ThiF n=1 Tax=Desulfatitalea alkaliphila TaxID=2929485 RepID=A0AA41R754_9BACT|nr:sulfur carrier protein ThiS adenylyltransferase ThiF [Desulfatitalea alkaliphila]MCJ8502460.1 sulfur carrier protein ThiS adenylyltransferase ThiF [Desulfatitalea alkaliphila]
MKKIGIAGAGGIGSNVAVHLVRAGVRCLKIVDFDRVELSNLNRQFYFHDQLGRPKAAALAANLRRIVPDAVIETENARLDAERMTTVFADCDLVVEGFDGAAEKKALLEAMSVARIPMVAACGVAGTRLDRIGVRTLGGCTIVGDFATEAAQAPCHGPKVALVAAMMAHIVLERGGYYE